MPTPAALVIDAQLRAARAPGPALLDALAGATTPAQVREAIDLAEARTRGWPSEPAALRRDHARELGITDADLDFRELYPGLDAGIYACSHSMGVPSLAGPAAVADHLRQLAERGIGTWDEGTWPAVMDLYRARCAELVGGNLEHGDVTWFPNVSDALSAVLECIPGGRLVYTSGHFTTGHYVHHQWANNTGGALVEVPTDSDGSVPTERVIDGLTADTTVVSISHALFESGWLQDLPAIAAAAAARSPRAIVLVDAYQTAGSVPIDVAALGDHVAVTAAGHKQLRSGTGAGFLYLPRRWLSELEPRRAGWWSHAAPFSFEKGAVRRAADGTRFRTGTPTVAGMAMLLGELAALASSAGGDLGAAVGRARAVTRGLVDVALMRARERGLGIRGDWGSDRRAAFVCVEVDRGAHIAEALGARGIRVDFRPREGEAGWIRVSGNAAAFPYEIDAVMDAIATGGEFPARP
jgi:kynureninase